MVATKQETLFLVGKLITAGDFYTSLQVAPAMALKGNLGNEMDFAVAFTGK